MNQSFENPKTLFSVAIFFLPFSMDALELVTSSYNLKRKISSEKKKNTKNISRESQTPDRNRDKYIYHIEKTIEIVRQLHDNFDNSTTKEKGEKNDTRDGYN